MPLETTLERIAVALETIAKITVSTAQGAPLVKPKKEKASETTAAPADDLLGMGDEKPLIVVTIDDLHKALNAFMGKSGIDETKKLMVKHGAKADKPTITTIPVEKYGALMDELKQKGV